MAACFAVPVIRHFTKGVILFGRKKFEVVETSFKSDKVHLFVRSLTTVPILCIYYILLINYSISIGDLFTILFLCLCVDGLLRFPLRAFGAFGCVP